jgi:hypothetical protein
MQKERPESDHFLSAKELFSIWKKRERRVEASFIFQDEGLSHYVP